MNARIASILKERISQFTYVDRLAGMVRVGQMERAGQVVKLPIAIDVDDDLACDDSTLREMVPDERYACMVYFEDRGFQRITSRTRGTSYRSSLRLVCWVNTAKLSSDPMAGERIMQQFLGVVHAPSPVNTDTLVGLRTTAETGPERGGSLFSSYTYPESARPFLMWPFDAFAIDIAAEYRLRPGCEEEPVPGDTECWTPPTTKRRKNPSEFTCEDLQDPVTGLTAEQLGPECLDCEGSGPCDPTTVNGVESDTPTITVLQGGVQVGTLNPATGVHTVPECEEPPPCDPMTVSLNGVEIVNQADPCGVDVALACDDVVVAVVAEGAGIPEADGLYIPNLRRIENRKPVYEHSADMGAGDDRRFRITSGGWWALFSNNATPEASFAYSSPSESPAPEHPYDVLQANWVEDTAPMLPVPTIRQATVADLCPCSPCKDATVNINGDPFDTVAAGDTLNIEVVNESLAPVGLLLDGQWYVDSAVYQLQDSAGNNIGALGSIPAEELKNITAPDASAQLKDSAGNNIGSPTAIRSNASANITAPDGSVQRRDSAGNAIGSAILVRSNQTGLDVTCPDATVRTTDGLTTVQVIRSDASGNLPQSVIKYKDASNVSQVTAASNTEFSTTLRPATEVPRRELKNLNGTGLGVYATVDRLIADTIPNVPIPLKFGWGAGEDTTLTWTVTSDEAGTYTSYTQDGSSGTITYSKNGAAYASLTGTITLAVGDTIAVKRTTFTSSGFSKWAP